MNCRPVFEQIKYLTTQASLKINDAEFSKRCIIMAFSMLQALTLLGLYDVASFKEIQKLYDRGEYIACLPPLSQAAVGFLKANK